MDGVAVQHNFETEEDVLNYLGVNYVEPQNRRANAVKENLMDPPPATAVPKSPAKAGTPKTPGAKSSSAKK